MWSSNADKKEWFKIDQEIDLILFEIIWSRFIRLIYFDKNWIEVIKFDEIRSNLIQKALDFILFNFHEFYQIWSSHANMTWSD